MRPWTASIPADHAALLLIDLRPDHEIGDAGLVLDSDEQRAAKWLLAAMQRTGDHVVPLTHEQLAAMLGVGRSYTSRVIQTFKSEGILETRRGSILVRDQEALKARSCLCSDSVKSHFERVLRGVYPKDET